MQNIQPTWTKNHDRSKQKKILNFLDVTLNLYTGKKQPYLKDGNKPKYINTKSNYPKAVLKAMPNSINYHTSHQTKKHS